MRDRFSARLPNARFDNVGEVIFRMVENRSWSEDRIAAHLRIDRLDFLPISDRVKLKTAQFYLAESVTIDIQLRAGAGVAVSGDVYHNHIQGASFPP